MKEETLFDSQNAAYAQAMYEEYARNPESVSSEWRRLFEDGAAQAIAQGLLIPRKTDEMGVTSTHAPTAPARPVPAEPLEDAPSSPDTATSPVPLADAAEGELTPAEDPEAALRAPTPPTEPSDAHEHLRRLLPVVSRAAALVQAFRDHGHQLARLDPLGSEPPGHPQLSPAFFGTSMEELSELPASLVTDDAEEGQSVSDALGRLSHVYAGSLGYEFEHLDDHLKVDWLWDRVESGSHHPPLAAEAKRALLKRICEVEGLEQFLHRTYLGQKRFSLEGTDMLVPMLDLLIERVAEAGAREVVLGMAHRGRLNVLTHTVGVSYGELLAEFEGPSFKHSQLHVAGTGDVKYHHGARGVREIEGVGRVKITLAPNPSHLEFVNPVVVGWARSRQFHGSGESVEPDFDSVVPVLIHGDAAFAAEG
ncbi:MAG TPA: hypothetical protein VLA09_14440, partial [Longimicrobiales bacterium]|nr:hypothetical protein [Longimicrobiales bacterium]